MDEIGTGGAWGDWLRNLGSQVVNTASQIEVMKTAQVGSAGRYYQEGVAGSATGTGGIPPTVLLLGAAAVVFLLLKG